MQTKTRYYQLPIFIILILLCTFLVTGCSCLWSLDPPRITRPVIGLDSENKNIEWYNTEETDIFDIYLNNQLIDTINITSEIVTFDYSSYVTGEDKYSFFVVAKSNDEIIEDSLNSNVITINTTPAYLNQKSSDYNFTMSNNLSIVTINDYVLSWNPYSGADKYLIRIFTNSTGYLEIITNDTTLDLKKSAYEFVKPHQIIICNISAINGSSLATTFTHTLEYNPDGSHMIVKFDGFVWDYYINSLDELNAIVYYNYLTRNTDYNITFSKDFAIALQEQYGNNIISIINTKINSALESFYETCYYRALKYKDYSSCIDSNKLIFNVAIDYYGVTLCDITVNQDVKYPQKDTDLLYFETYDYETNGKRTEDFDDFASDKYLLTQVVSNSDQLVAMVESNITPICVKNSRADLIYKAAKTVLREIISDNMSDYEKALTIFDWITYNTNYDYLSLQNSADIEDYIVTKDCCYYLEGVFFKKLAVCDGYSKAFSLLCNMEGIECVRIVGDAYYGESGGGHAWNKVKINDEYFVVDITWTELTYENTEYLSHKYFLVGETAIGLTHFAYNVRERFNLYPTRLNPTLSYYSQPNLSYIDPNGQETAVTQYIDSSEDLVTALNFPIYNNKSNLELVFDYEYLITLRAKYEADNLSDGLQREMKSVKFSSQLISQIYDTNLGNYNIMRYGDKFGLVCLINTNYIINEDDELVTLIETFGQYANINNQILNTDIEFTIDEQFLINKFQLTEGFDDNWGRLTNHLNQYLSTVNDQIYCIYSIVCNQSYESIRLNNNNDLTKLYHFTLKIQSPSIPPLNSPTITITDNKILSWNSIDAATTYSIFANSILVATTSNLTYDLSTIITEPNLYNITVVANTTNPIYKSSSSSNSVKFLILDNIVLDEVNNTLYWSGINNANSYNLIIESTTKQIYTIPLNEHDTYTIDLLTLGLTSGSYIISVEASYIKNSETITTTTSNLINYIVA